VKLLRPFSPEQKGYPDLTILQKQNRLALPTNLEERVRNIVNNPKSKCAEFIKNMITMAARIDGGAYSNDPLDVFNRVQKQAGFKLKNI
jgi:hypothetical protein